MGPTEDPRLAECMYYQNSPEVQTCITGNAKYFDPSTDPSAGAKTCAEYSDAFQVVVKCSSTSPACEFMLAEQKAFCENTPAVILGATSQASDAPCSALNCADLFSLPSMMDDTMDDTMMDEEMMDEEMMDESMMNGRKAVGTGMAVGGVAMLLAFFGFVYTKAGSN